jgi:hypothetical protein
MHPFALALLSPAQWLPVLVLAVALFGARRLRPGLPLLALLGAALAAGGMAGVLLGEMLLFVLATPQPRSLAAFLGVWPTLLPVLCGAACTLPLLLRRRLPTCWEAADALLAGAAVWLLATAWRHPLPPLPR